MGGSVGFIVLVLLATSWCCNARGFVGSNLPVEHSDIIVGVRRNQNVCMLCQEFAAEALTYLSENMTQTGIILFLHNSCSKLGSFKRQCIALVDYYAPLFFLEISSLEPEAFCQKVDLCEEVASYAELLSKNSCGICQQAVAEVVLKLKDPDTQLEILELLLKGCEGVKKYAKKCKRLVFEYAPLIIANAEQFLESTDICSVLHICPSPAAITQEDLSNGEASLLSKF